MHKFNNVQIIKLFAYVILFLYWLFQFFMSDTLLLGYELFFLITAITISYIPRILKEIYKWYIFRTKKLDTKFQSKYLFLYSILIIFQFISYYNVYLNIVDIDLKYDILTKYVVLFIIIVYGFSWEIPLSYINDKVKYLSIYNIFYNIILMILIFTSQVIYNDKTLFLINYIFISKNNFLNFILLCFAFIINMIGNLISSHHNKKVSYYTVFTMCIQLILLMGLMSSIDNTTLSGTLQMIMVLAFTALSVIIQTQINKYLET